MVFGFFLEIDSFIDSFIELVICLILWCVCVLVVAMFPFILKNFNPSKSSKFLIDDEEEEENETQKEYHEEEEEEDCIPKIIPQIVAMDSLGMHSQTKIGKWIK